MRGESKFMLVKDDKLKALYATELERFLEKIGKLDLFQQGKIMCRYCGSEIGENNLYAFIPVGEDVEFCCTSPTCVIELSKEAK